MSALQDKKILTLALNKIFEEYQDSEFSEFFKSLMNVCVQSIQQSDLHQHMMQVLHVMLFSSIINGHDDAAKFYARSLARLGRMMVEGVTKDDINMAHVKGETIH